MGRATKNVGRVCPWCLGSFLTSATELRGGRGRHCSLLCARRAQGVESARSLAEDLEHFWGLVAAPNADGCRLWLGYRDPKGYGQVRFKGKRRMAHRLAYELLVGPLPQGMCACHRCDVAACCEPSHLFPGTKADNNADMARKGRASRGERHHWAKLTEVEVGLIRLDTRKGVEIAKAFGISGGHVSAIRSRKTWTHA